MDAGHAAGQPVRLLPWRARATQLAIDRVAGDTRFALRSVFIGALARQASDALGAVRARATTVDARCIHAMGVPGVVGLDRPQRLRGMQIDDAEGLHDVDAANAVQAVRGRHAARVALDIWLRLGLRLGRSLVSSYSM